MPTYIELQNLIVSKDIIVKKYKGGIEAFRIWFDKETGSRSQEDNETFSIARMNSCDRDIEALVNNGLSFDFDKKHSDDFCVISRYEGSYWKVDWLEGNTIFAWHKDCKIEQIEQANKIGATPIEEIEAAFDRGETPFDTIK